MTVAERPLAGLTVVVCRAAADAASLLDRLEAAGARAVSIPLHHRVVPADGGQALRRAVAALETYDWLVATSANGVRAVLHELGDRAVPAALRVAAVGGATAAAFAEGGVAVTIVPERATAAELAAALPAGEGQVVLAPLNEAADDALTAGLEARGFVVDRVDAYRMAEPPERPGDRDAVAAADAVLLTAPSIVDRFCDRFGPEAVPAVAVCIGPSTEARARSRGLDRLVVAATSSEGGLIEALVDTLGSTDRTPADRPSPRDGTDGGSSDAPRTRTAGR